MKSTKVKYPRTPHLPWSLGCTSDDKMLKSVGHFEGKEVVVTEKLDGENTTMYRDHIHARSLDSIGGVDRDWVKALWSSLRYDLPVSWRICGENLWARHSIPYENLESYFYGFSVWDGEECFDWDDTLVTFKVLGIVPVPVLYRGIWDEATIRNLPLDPMKNEGYVVRLADSFCYNDFGSSVAKFVRENHVQTNDHWRHQKITPNILKQQ